MNENLKENAILTLLEWGKIKLLRPHLEDYLKDIELEYGSIIQSDENIKVIVDTAVVETEQMIKEARRVLSDRALITADEGDEIFYQSQEALDAFDRINFLYTAIKEFLKPSEHSIAVQALEKLDKMMGEVLSWLDDSNWSSLRLTTINSYRKELLEKIPQEQRYLFPWYEVFVEYDEDIIEVLIQNYDCLLEKDKCDRLPQILQDNLRELLFEITKDEELLSTIKERHVLHKKILEAVSLRSSLALLHLSEKKAIDFPVSDIVASKGMVRLSRILIQNAIQTISNEAEKIYWLYLSAFCGPDLTDRQRLELLDFVERKIKDINVQSIDTQIALILNPLKQWLEGRDNDEWLTKFSYERWNGMLEGEARKIAQTEYEIDEAVEQFWSKIQELKRQPIWLSELIESIIAALRPTPTMEALSVPTRGEEEAEIETVSLRKNNLKITVYPNAIGEYPLLPTPALIADSDDALLYSYLYNYIARIKQIYCGGILIKEDEKEELSIVELGATRKQFHKVQEGTYQKALIGISSHRDQVEQFIEQSISFMKEEENIQKVVKSLNMILVIFSFEKRMTP